MSRIGKAPIPIPNGVELVINGQDVSVKGPKGNLERSFHEKVRISVDGDVATVERFDDQRDSRALHGLSRALLANMVTGVTQGFRKELSIVGVGYRANLQGTTIELQVGYSHPVHIEALKA